MKLYKGMAFFVRLGLRFLSILFVSVVFCIGVSYAENNDCELVNAPKVEDNLAHLWTLNYENFYPKTAIKQALINLKAYCCQEKKLSEETCKDENFPAYFPESLFLFDHLLDIGLRRLDAASAYGLTVDEKGDAWRKYIGPDTAESVDPKNAGTMEKTATEYRSKSSEYNEIFTSWSTVSSVTNIDLENLNTEYPKASLQQRYKEQCGIAAALYLKAFYVFGKNKDNVSLIQKVFDSNNTSTKMSCEALVNARIGDEFVYFKTVIISKSMDLLENGMNSYLTNYFGDNRLSNLQNSIFLLSDVFTTVAKAVPEGTPECN